MTALQIEKTLLTDGWYCVGAKGSHKHFKHPTKPGKITVPQHRGDLDKKTERSILKQAGLL